MRRGERALFQFDQRVVGADGVHGLDQDLFDDAVAGGADALLHLHGLDNAHFLAGGDPLSGPDEYGDDPSGQGRGDDVVWSAAGGAAGGGRRYYDAWGLVASTAGAGSGLGGQAFNFDQEGLAFDGDLDRGMGQFAYFDVVPVIPNLDPKCG